jgi:hypothetical protein
MAAEDSASFKKENATDADKARVAELTYQQSLLEEEVTTMEILLKDKKRKLTDIEQRELPEAMDKVGLSEFKTKNGTKVSVRPFYNASIPADRKDEALDWLEVNDHGGIIKTTVATSFGKGEHEFAKAFLQFARGFNEHPVDPEMTRGVHAQTLKAFVREMMEKGASIPLDMFGVHMGRKAVIKRAKEA